MQEIPMSPSSTPGAHSQWAVDPLTPVKSPFFPHLPKMKRPDPLVWMLPRWISRWWRSNHDLWGWVLVVYLLPLYHYFTPSLDTPSHPLSSITTHSTPYYHNYNWWLHQLCYCHPLLSSLSSITAQSSFLYPLDDSHHYQIYRLWLPLAYCCPRLWPVELLPWVAPSAVSQHKHTSHLHPFMYPSIV